MSIIPLKYLPANMAIALAITLTLLVGCQSTPLKDGSIEESNTDKPKTQITWQLNSIPYLDAKDYPNDPLAKELKAREIAQRPNQNPKHLANMKALLADFVTIPKGCFKMGEYYKYLPSKQHKVCLKSFKLSSTEATLDIFDYFSRATGRPLINDGKNWRSNRFRDRSRSPIPKVSFKDVQAFLSWSNEIGLAVRLPSEAEWEYAARAGTTTKYSWGDKPPTCNRKAKNGANGLEGDLYTEGYSGLSSKEKEKKRKKMSCNNTVPFYVASYRANPWGLYDMHGNVAEWTQDCWHETYDGAPTDGSAWVSNIWSSDGCTKHAVRGGNAAETSRYLTTYSRSRFGYQLTGFRLAMDL